MGVYRELFIFAAKAGSLEGYLYEREEVKSLSNWAENIDKMYHNLPDEVKKDMGREFGIVLTRILGYGNKLLEAESKSRLNKLHAEVES
jgi:hypothetical protein